MRTIAIIGSFRPGNYAGVTDVIGIFRGAGAVVLSPSGAEISSGHEFVRFATDDPEFTDEAVQSMTLGNIFAADAVYVVAPNGYVGRTTCYEIGRIVQRRQPIYFSERPNDLPVHIPHAFVATPTEFVLRFLTGEELFAWVFQDGEGAMFDVERRIASAP